MVVWADYAENYRCDTARHLELLAVLPAVRSIDESCGCKSGRQNNANHGCNSSSGISVRDCFQTHCKSDRAVGGRSVRHRSLRHVGQRAATGSGAACAGKRLPGNALILSVVAQDGGELNYLPLVHRLCCVRRHFQSDRRVAAPASREEPNTENRQQRERKQSQPLYSKTRNREVGDDSAPASSVFEHSGIRLQNCHITLDFFFRSAQSGGTEPLVEAPAKKAKQIE